MKKPVSISKLLKSRSNDDPHTGHVTTLALELFDQAQGHLDLSAHDRTLLQTAARLHDIGYEEDPTDHARASAELVSQTPIKGLTNEDRQQVAAIIALHPRKLKKARTSPFVTNAPHRKQALQLGAILRVADGLDHGHVQDAHIVSVTRHNKTLQALIRSDWYNENITWAQSKSNLWSEIFPLPLILQEDSSEGKRRLFSGLVQKDDSTLEAARRLFYSQYRIFTDSRDGAMSGVDPTYLHDIRVALRRFRAAIELFRPKLKKTSASELDRVMRDLGDLLGPVRDQDVWIQFLENNTSRLAGANPIAWDTFMQTQYAAREEAYDRLREILREDNYIPAVARMAHFLRVELPTCLRKRKATPLRPYGAEVLAPTFERIMKHRKFTRDESSEEMHDLRRLCRKERYWAEFLAPALGSPVPGLARKLKGIADRLGDIHDMDIHLAETEKTSSALPEELVTLMRKERKSAAKDFQKRWQKLTERTYRKKVQKTLNKIAEGS